MSGSFTNQHGQGPSISHIPGHPGTAANMLPNMLPSNINMSNPQQQGIGGPQFPSIGQHVSGPVLTATPLIGGTVVSCPPPPMTYRTLGHPPASFQTLSDVHQGPSQKVVASSVGAMHHPQPVQLQHQQVSPQQMNPIHMQHHLQQQTTHMQQQMQQPMHSQQQPPIQPPIQPPPQAMQSQQHLQQQHLQQQHLQQQHMQQQMQQQPPLQQLLSQQQVPPPQQVLPVKQQPIQQQQPVPQQTVVTAPQTVQSGQQQHGSSQPQPYPSISSLTAGGVVTRNIGKIDYFYFDFKYLAARNYAGLAMKMLGVVHELHIAPDINSEEWKEYKEALITQGHPDGQLPVIAIDDQHHFSESLAMTRYIFRKVGMYGLNPLADMFADMVSYKAEAWRIIWAKGTFSQIVGEKEYYLESERIKQYRTLESCLETHPGVCFLGDEPRMPDIVVFCSLWDDILFYGGEMINDFPRLASFFDMMRKVPHISEWCDEAEAAYHGENSGAERTTEDAEPMATTEDDA